MQAVLGEELGAVGHVIAADSGLYAGRRLGLAVDLLIGDLDSVDEADLADASFEIDRHPRAKDQTDIALALDPAERFQSAAELRAALEDVLSAAGFSDVETFIASGNVIFRSGSGDTAALEARIEKALQASLGYPVTAFIRRAGELDTIARHEPFAADGTPGILHVGFLRAAVTAAAEKKSRPPRR